MREVGCDGRAKEYLESCENGSRQEGEQEGE